MAKKTFDRTTRREHLLADYGISMLLKKQKSETDVVEWALSCLESGVQAALCDLDTQAIALFERSFDWLRSESNRSTFGYQQHVGFALSSWILNGTLESDALNKACDYLRDYLPSSRDKIDVTHNLPVFLLAEQYIDVRRIFDATKGLTQPDALNRIRCPGKMSYVIASHELNREPDSATLGETLRAFLRFQIPVCLHIHRSSLGTEREVPVWMYLESRYLQEKPVYGVEALRNALNYVYV